MSNRKQKDGSAKKDQSNYSRVDGIEERNAAITFASTEDYSSDSDKAGKAKMDEAKYKTEMCKNFQATGACNYGKKCKFAHGKTDLVSKQIQSSKMYKTKTCKAFHEELICTYGSRCHFKHDQRSLEETFKSNFYARKLMLLSLLSTSTPHENSIIGVNSSQSSLSSRLSVFANMTQ